MFDDAGFIASPGGLFPAQNPAVVAVGHLDPLRCVVVLGDPGIGKSTLLKAEYERAREAHTRTLWVDLGAFDDSRQLSEQIFEDAVWSTTSSDDDEVVLFLDGLDEAWLRLPTVSDLLVRELAAVDTARLRLRLSCRPAQWPASLGDELARLWPDAPPVIRNLLPLQRSEVANTARAAELDGDAFVSEVVRLGIAALAGHPLTLRLLIAGVRAGQGLPHTQIEAYRRGLRLLCEEPDDDRREHPSTSGTLGSGGRLAVARRIAAAVILSGRATVWNAPDTGGASDAAVLRGAIVGGSEADTTGAAPRPVQVDESAVAEALGTALFLTRSTHRELQFAHQSFGEFLAADWLSRLDFTRIASLLCLPGDPERRIIPQLQNVAAWAAALNADVFAHVLAVDADLLLRPSLARVAPEQRREVVDALLDLAEQDRIEFRGESVRPALADLGHPELAEQLLEVLRNTGRQPRARELACEIAAACNMTALEDALIDLAIDATAPVRLRTSAVLAFDDVASHNESRSRLIELASADLDLEGADDLKGAALRAVWPEVIDAEQLFAAITPPRAPEALSLYTGFMAGELVDGLQNADLAVALDWTAEHYDPYGLGRLNLLALQILARAWSQIHDAVIADEIAEMVRTQLVANHPLLQPTAVGTNDLFVSAAGRHQVVQRLVPALLRGEISATSLVHSEPALVLREDLSWVLEQLNASLETEEERAWAILANQLWAYDDEAVELIWEAMEYSQQLYEIAADRFDAIPLDSELAENLRRWYERQKRIHAEQAAREAEQQAWTSALAQRVSAAAADPQTTWPQLSALITGELHDALSREAQECAVDSPGFNLADAATRQILIDSAEHYLLTADLAPDDWLGSGEIPYRVISAIRALDLLLTEAPNRYESLAPDVWSRVIPAVVAHLSSQGAKAAAVREFRRHANAIDPARVAQSLTRIVIGEDRRNGRAWQLDHADELRSHELEGSLTEALERGNLRPDSAADIVSYGLRANYASIRQWALEQIDRVPDLSWAQLDYVVALRVAVKLIQGAAAAGWPSVWRAMQGSELWGREFAAAVVEIDAPRLDRTLQEAELAELFCWLQDHFPAQEDPRTQMVSQRTRIAWWRDSLLDALVRRGTDAGVQALVVIRDRYPALEGLSTLVVQAGDVRRAAAWRPPTPTAVVELGLHLDRRLVASDLDLLRVVLEALERIQRRLRPPAPAAPDLWDTAAHKPKAEEDISDWLQRQMKDEFDRRLILIDREVQVSRLPGGGVGERTDLLIQAVAGQDLEEAEMVSLVIEVKGCWNRGLGSDMNEQLAARYLNPHERRCGIYLIAWFGREQWANSDNRRRRCAAARDSVEATYEQQAHDLSTASELQVRSVVLDCSLPESRRST